MSKSGSKQEIHNRDRYLQHSRTENTGGKNNANTIGTLISGTNKPPKKESE